VKHKLFAAKAELKIRQRQMNAAIRSYDKVLGRIDGITRKLAGAEPAPKHFRRSESIVFVGARESEPPQGDGLAAPASEVQRDAGVAGAD
jgi:hypothetical protein